MARNPILALAFFGFLTATFPAPVESQSIPSPYQFLENRQEAGIFLGSSNPGTGRFGFGPNPGIFFGARYGIHIGGAFGLEGTFGYSPTTRDVVDPTREEGDMVVGEADAEIFSFDARLRFSITGDRSWKGLNPFAFFGGGLITDFAGEGQADALVLPEDRFELGTKVVAVFGGGVRWIVSPRFLIRAEAGLSMYKLETPPGFLEVDRGFVGVGEKEWVSGPTFSIGAGFHF